MDIRPLFRPWALVVLFLFVAVAVVDFVDSVRTVPEPLPRLLAPERLDFKGSDGDDGSDAIIIDYEKERLSIRRSGTVFIRFTMNDRVDALVLDYRYGGGGGEAAVVLARTQPSEHGMSAGVKDHLSSAERRDGRIRIPLHGHEGDFVLSVEAEIASPTGELLFTSMRLIEEN